MESNATRTDKDKRESFRIDDSLPVLIHKLEDKDSSAPLDSALEDLKELSGQALPEDGINPYLWKMLVNLHRKLDLVLERLPVDLMKNQPQPVNLSSTGMRVRVKKKFNLEDEVKIKMLLPTVPVKEILFSGKVVRIKALEDGEYEVALHFHNLDDEVREEIIQYSLKQQRKIIMAQREKRGKDGSINRKSQ